MACSSPQLVQCWGVCPTGRGESIWAEQPLQGSDQTLPCSSAWARGAARGALDAISPARVLAAIREVHTGQRIPGRERGDLEGVTRDPQGARVLVVRAWW